MKKILLLVVAAAGALAFWRKDTLKDDVGKAGDAVKTAGEKVRSRGQDAVDDASAVADEALASVADEPGTA